MPSRKKLTLEPDPAYKPTQDFQVSHVGLSYIYKGNVTKRPRIISPADAYRVGRSLWDENKIGLLEEFKVLYLNRAHYVISAMTVAFGGIASTSVDMRHILTAGLLQNASGFIMLHNHPSGDTTPSQADRDLTISVYNAGKVVKMPARDHIIIAPPDQYFSFKEAKILPY